MHQHRLYNFISSSEVVFRKATLLKFKKACLDLAAKFLLCCCSLIFLNWVFTRCDLKLCKVK